MACGEAIAQIMTDIHGVIGSTHSAISPKPPFLTTLLTINAPYIHMISFFSPVCFFVLVGLYASMHYICLCVCLYVCLCLVCLSLSGLSVCLPCRSVFFHLCLFCFPVSLFVLPICLSVSSICLLHLCLFCLPVCLVYLSVRRTRNRNEYDPRKITSRIALANHPKRSSSNSRGPSAK